MEKIKPLHAKTRKELSDQLKKRGYRATLLTILATAGCGMSEMKQDLKDIKNTSEETRKQINFSRKTTDSIVKKVEKTEQEKYQEAREEFIEATGHSLSFDDRKKQESNK